MSFEQSTLSALGVVDILWLIIATGLVFLMQPGFACLESGLTRSKNSVNVALKNILDFCVAIALFSLFGYTFMFLGFDPETGWPYLSPTFDAESQAAENIYFLYQACFCGTATTIASGAVAERMRFNSYLVLSCIISGACYPVVGQWIWGGTINPANAGWLERMGFHDFAGATVVHGVGAWSALSAVIILGPREGRFRPDGSIRAFSGSNLPLAALGVFLLWMGWIGFNGGSTLSVSDSATHALVNTLIAGAFGGLGVLWIRTIFRIQVSSVSLFNGIIAGLVAATASASSISTLSTILVAASAAVIVEGASLVIERRFRLDDAVGAIAAHGVAGVWGTIAYALFVPDRFLREGVSRLEQLGVQSLGVVAVFAYSFLVTSVLLLVVRRFTPLRATPEEEQIGLNLADHGERSEMADLVATMRAQLEGDFAARAIVDPHSDAGVIAHQFNRVVEMNESIRADLIDREVKIRQAKDEAERAIEVKNQFLTNMSHELRTPLTAILGYTDILQSKETDGPTREKLTTIQSHGRHLLNLLDDVLDVAQYDREEIRIQCRPVDPMVVIDEVTSLLRIEATAKKLELSVNRVGSVPSTIVTDGKRLRQVLLNIIGNAIKFTRQGHVSVSVQIAPHDARDERLVIEVADTGVGIPADMLDRLATPFFRADEGTNREFGGVGLGLCIGKRIVDGLGGSMTIESIESVGTKVHIEIPTRRKQGITLKSEPAKTVCRDACPTVASLAGARILLASGDGSSLAVVAHMLEEEGASLQFASSAQETLDLCQATRPGSTPIDLVLIDENLSDAKGEELAKRLREQGCEASLILVNADPLQEGDLRYVSAGLDQCIARPAATRSIMDCIKCRLTKPEPTGDCRACVQQNLVELTYTI